MIRIVKFIIAITYLILTTTTLVKAELIVRATDNAGNQLIYDTALDITWYDRCQLFIDWSEAAEWADSLSVSIPNSTFVYDDWRLPDALNQDETGPCEGYDCINSEMGHLYYISLGNQGYDTSQELDPQHPFGLQNTGPFNNLKPSKLWSGTIYFRNPGLAWIFYFGEGRQYYVSTTLSWFHAVAVRDGNITTANCEGVKRGDINNDDAIDMQDEILCLRIISGLFPITQNFCIDSDIGGNRKISLEDAAYILQNISENK